MPAHTQPSGTPWTRNLGLSLVCRTAREATIELPAREQNINLAGRLHGGVIATALLEAGRALIGGTEPGARLPDPLDFRIFYLRGGANEVHTARASLLHAGRSYAFIEATLHAADPERPLARATYCLRMPGQSTEPPRCFSDEAAAELPAVDDHPVAAALNRRYAEQGRGARVIALSDGQTRVEQTLAPAVLDAGATLAPGYLLLLIDSVGSMVSYTDAGKIAVAATLGLDAAFHAPVIDEPVIATGRRLTRQNDVFHNRVVLHGQDSGLRLATATVTYLLREKTASETT